MSTPASHLDPFISTWNRVHQQTVKLMQTAPSDKFDWKTCESAMPLGELMNHLWLGEKFFVSAVLTGEAPKEWPAPINQTDELIATYEQSHNEAVAQIAALTPEQLAESVAPFGPERPLSRQALLNVMNEHEIHHRGQLYTYLRILGVEVPSLFA